MSSCDYQVTHLIAGNVGTTKYHVARSLKLPVLLPQWVESCWKESVTSSMSATDDVILSQHRCLPFTGCTITVTGLDEGARQRVKEACQMNGGNYFGELTKGVCTHLLVGNKASKWKEGGGRGRKGKRERKEGGEEGRGRGRGREGEGKVGKEERGRDGREQRREGGEFVFFRCEVQVCSSVEDVLCFSELV